MATKKQLIVLTVVLSCCWTVQGNPVGNTEMRQGFSEGFPLSEDELNCIPMFSKGETNTTHLSEGDDIVVVPQKNAFVDRKWPDANAIPYVIDSTFDERGRCAIGYAMNQYRQHTCIRFVPRTNEDVYIQINRIDTTEWSCYSVGLGNYGYYQFNDNTPGAHPIYLAPACYASQPGTVMHELMHRIGFDHEHTRPDRDDYIDINWSQVSDARQYQIATGSSLLLNYDYGSVMHYGLGKTMTTKQDSSGIRIGQRNGFSQLDIQKLNMMYNCEAPATTTTEEFTTTTEEFTTATEEFTTATEEFTTATEEFTTATEEITTTADGYW